MNLLKTNEGRICHLPLARLPRRRLHVVRGDGAAVKRDWRRVLLWIGLVPVVGVVVILMVLACGKGGSR